MGVCEGTKLNWQANWQHRLWALFFFLPLQTCTASVVMHSSTCQSPTPSWPPLNKTPRWLNFSTWTPPNPSHPKTPLWIRTETVLACLSKSITNIICSTEQQWHVFCDWQWLLLVCSDIPRMYAVTSRIYFVWRCFTVLCLLNIQAPNPLCSYSFWAVMHVWNIKGPQTCGDFRVEPVRLHSGRKRECCMFWQKHFTLRIDSQVAIRLRSGTPV